MPYAWSPPATPDGPQELRAWPHNSLPPEGFAAAILAVFGLATIPLSTLLGTALLWGLLPFMLLAVGGLWWGLRRNFRDRAILEILTLDPTCIRLVRRNPDGAAQDWECNPYWAKVALHPDGGPVPFYVTLTGCGREVEIGAFLSEDERKALYADLADRLRRIVAR
ncbi:DUF2244 domain-containing protein [Roseivivax sp. CAU 1761]